MLFLFLLNDNKGTQFASFGASIVTTRISLPRRTFSTENDAGGIATVIGWDSPWTLGMSWVPVGSLPLAAGITALCARCNATNHPRRGGPRADPGLGSRGRLRGGCHKTFRYRVGHVRIEPLALEDRYTVQCRPVCECRLKSVDETKKEAKV